MKKLILGAAMMIGFISLSTAQQIAATKPATKPVTPATKPVAAKSTATVTAPKAPATATAAKTPATVPVTKPATATAKPTKPIAAKPTNAQGQVLKKDGTPDKRYNNPPAATGPVKKDGTPDKRYKENQKN